MKKIFVGFSLFFIVLIILVFSNIQISKTMPLVPKGASWKLYPYDGAPGQLGHWERISVHYDKLGELAWGENQCRPGGDECHLWDWVTWWFPIISPEPPGPSGNYGPPLQFDCDSVIYDPISGKYLCQ